MSFCAMEAKMINLERLLPRTHDRVPKNEPVNQLDDVSFMR